MKNHHHNGPIHGKAREAIHEDIATRAYLLWLESGRPDGRADEFWLEAERQHMDARGAAPVAEDQPVSN